MAPGQVFSAIKSDHLEGGRLYAADELPAPDWYRPLAPLLRTGIVPAHEKDDAKLSEAIGKIVHEDPSLTAEHDSETGAHVLAGQGALHLRRARETLAEAFGVETSERPLTPPLRETITKPADVHYRHKKQTGGAGQFADVKLKVAPLPRGEGFQFDQAIHGGSVPKNYIPAVEAGARDATDRGPLGFPVVDVAVTLYDGQYHSVDSSDMAFRIAARGGVRQALDEAGAVLLEPIYEVRFLVPSIFTGALNPLVSSRRGQVLGFDRLSRRRGLGRVPGAAARHGARRPDRRPALDHARGRALRGGVPPLPGALWPRRRDDDPEPRQGAWRTPEGLGPSQGGSRSSRRGGCNPTLRGAVSGCTPPYGSLPLVGEGWGGGVRAASRPARRPGARALCAAPRRPRRGGQGRGGAAREWRRCRQRDSCPC